VPALLRGTASLGQWSNLGAAWIHGDLNPSKATLLEGDSVPYQDQFSSLNVGPGNNYVFTFQWQTTNSSLHAQDYVTSYDYTWHGGSGSGTTVDGHELDGTGLPSSTPFTTFQIPTDPNINSGPASNFMINGHTPVGSPTNPPNQFVTLYGATLTGISGYMTYALTGTTFQTLSISFTTAPTGSVPDPVSNPVLLWGGHVASQLDWGPGSGASGIPGSPYHTVQQSLTLNGVNVPGVGAEAVGLKTGVVISPTIIVVNKVANPALASQNFGFTNASNVFFMPGQPSNFVNSFSVDGSNTFLVPPYNLPGASGNNVELLQTTTFNQTALTQITESPPAGWTLSNISIHSLNGTTGSSQSGNTAILNCAEGDTLWVTFTDTFHGTSSAATVIQDATTHQAPSSTLGESVLDTATITGSPALFSPTGTVTYTLTGSQLANLAPTAGWTVVNPTTWTDTVTLSGGVAPNSTATPALRAGSYQFLASYSGDSNYAASTSPVEPLTINQGSAATATRILDAFTSQPPSGTLGESVLDTATVSGTPFTPTGTVTYQFFTNGTGSGLPASTQTVTLGANGTVPNSSVQGPLAAGAYSFIAIYNGDSNYKGSTSPVEPLTINQGTSSTATTILDATTSQAPNGILGESVFDTATLSRSPTAFTPTGTVTYEFFTNGTGTGSPASTETVTLNADGSAPNSGVQGPLIAGSYSFIAIYSGDGNYKGSTSAVEPLTISLGSSSTTTAILDAATNQAPTNTLGESVFDTATVSGAPFTATGTVTYTLTGSALAGLTAPPGWTVVNTTTWTDTVTLSAGVPPNSAATPALPAGSYQFQASYSGDSNYTGSTSALEPLKINQGSASTATEILDSKNGEPPSGEPGEKVFDTAAVTTSPPVFTPTGTVTYEFFTNGTASGPPASTETVTLNPDGTVPDSAVQGPLKPGAYSFIAIYSGDSNYLGSTSPVEPLTTGTGVSNTVTDILDAGTGQPPSGSLGESVVDSAIVTGFPPSFTPTGTVTYIFTGSQLANLTAPPGWTVVNATTWTDRVVLIGEVTPNSLATPALPAGSYQFQAIYSGDEVYDGSTSAIEPLIIHQGSNSSTATEIQDVSGGPPSNTLGESVLDTATVTGSPFTPTGTLTYTFTGLGLASLTTPAGWTVVNATTWTDTVTLSGGVVPNSPATPGLPAGSYQFQASYSGDGNYAGSTSDVEPLTINQGSSSTATTILDAATSQPPSGTLGESVFDTATVSGTPFTPTGTVTYEFFTNSSRSGLAASTDTVTLNPDGTVPNSAVRGPLAAGLYSFIAIYSGDSNYAASTSPVEPLIITRGSSSTATTILDSTGGSPTGTTGESVFDTAEVTGTPAAFTPAGTVTYEFFTNGTGSGSPASTETVMLNADGTVPNSALQGPLPAGAYSFIAIYSGDRNYAGSTSPVEPLTISPGSSSTTTAILDAATSQPPTGILGESVFDTAIVSAGPFTPTGTVTYTLTGSALAGLTAPADWTVVNATTWTDTVMLSGGVVPDSAATPDLPAGSYDFQASYSGDSNYQGSTSALEPLTINQGSTSTSTAILDAATSQAPSGTLGESVFDTAAVTASPAAFTPTGTLTYEFFTNGTGSGTPASTETVTLNPDGTVPDSAVQGPLAAGAYSFIASYSGDSNYAGSTSAVEPLAINQGSSTTATIILDAATSDAPSGTLGESVFDTATVMGSPNAFTPTGTVMYTFTGSGLANLTAPPGWTVVNSTTWTDTVTLTGGAVPDSAVTPDLPAGSYQFQASYSGDGNYAGSTSALEPLTINQGSSSTATAILDAATSQPPSGALGESVFDTATVTGSPTAFTPTGTVTYEFFTNDTGSGSPASTEMVTLNPDGTVPDSGVHGPLAAGAYSFIAVYSGDSNYTGSTSPVEPLTIGQTSSTTATTIQDVSGGTPSGALGESVFDTATVSGSPFTPTGTVTYTFTGSALANLTAPAGWTVVNPTTWTDTVTLSGGVAPDSAATPALPAGGYQFQATYSGDGNYTASTSAPEPLTINQGDSATTTTILDAATRQPPSGTLGKSVIDTASVSGVPITPTGTVTYEFFTNGSRSGLPVSTQVVTLNPDGTVPDSAVHGRLAAGSYSFIAIYSGDSNFNGSISAIEPLTINQGGTRTATTILDAATNQPPSGTLGESVFDTATVTGTPAAFTPTGTVTYEFFTNGSGTGSPASTEMVTLNSDGTVPNSAVEGPLTAGEYSFIAIYSGDPNYAGSTSPVEPLTINQASSSTTTAILDASIRVSASGTLGNSVFDTPRSAAAPL
jgi:hypothetical protein